MDTLKTQNWLTNWMIDRVADSTTLDQGTRAPKAGFWQGTIGSALGLNTDAIADAKYKQVQNTEALDYLDSVGETPEALGLKSGNLTKAGAITAIKKRDKADKKADQKEERGYLADVRQEGYDRQDASFRHTASEAAKDRALTRDLNLSSSDMKMQMKFMDMDLADKRMAYDRETRRMDKRDRAIASLMAGIGQLGGAFAL